MANFLRSFGLGFVRAANQQFDERRQLETDKDLAFSKVFTQTLAARTVATTSATKAKKDKKDSAAIAQALGLSGATQAAIQGGLVDPNKAFEFSQSTKGQLAGTEFTPGQEFQPSVIEQFRNLGFSDERINQEAKDRGIDLSDPRFQGQTATTPQVTGLPPGGVVGALPSQADQRIEKLATSFVGKPNMFASDRDFKQAQIAFKDGDFEGVVDLTAKSPRLQNDVLLPIIEQVLEFGPESLNENQRFVLDLFKPRDPIDQLINRLVLQNIKGLEQVIQDGLDGGTISEPPGNEATDEERLNWWEQNLGPMFEGARKYWEEVVRGRKSE